MTTIAIKDGTVAVDSQCTDQNYAFGKQKLARLPDGGVAVSCGNAAAGYAGVRWLADGERGDPPDIEGANITIVRPDGSVWLACERWPAFPILNTTYADGCGRDLARMAMAKGATAVQAVAEACEHDAMSSAPIFSMTVYPPRGDGLQVHTVTKTKAKQGASRKPRKARK